MLQVPHTFVQGTKAMPDEVNENFDYCTEQMQLLIDKFDTKDATTDSKIASMKNQILELIKYDLFPTGAICMWGPAAVPTNFVAMIGQTNLDNYPKLKALGYTFLPDTRDKFPQGAAVGSGFSIISPGLPNITGYIDPWTAHSNASIGTRDGSGAFYSTGTGTIISRGETANGCSRGLGFNASRSNGIYGRSNTVQPPTWTTVFIIKYQ